MGDNAFTVMPLSRSSVSPPMRAIKDKTDNFHTAVYCNMLYLGSSVNKSTALFKIVRMLYVIRVTQLADRGSIL